MIKLASKILVSALAVSAFAAPSFAAPNSFGLGKAKSHVTDPTAVGALGRVGSDHASPKGVSHSAHGTKASGGKGGAGGTHGSGHGHK